MATFEGLRFFDGGPIQNSLTRGMTGKETSTSQGTIECGIYRRSGQTRFMRINTPCWGRFPSLHDINAFFDSYVYMLLYKYPLREVFLPELITTVGIAWV